MILSNDDEDKEEQNRREQNKRGTQSATNMEISYDSNGVRRGNRSTGTNTAEAGRRRVKEEQGRAEVRRGGDEAAKSIAVLYH